MKDRVGSNIRWYFVVDGDARMQLDIPLNFEAGSKYKVSVKALAASESDATNIMSCYRVICEGVAHFRAGNRCCAMRGHVLEL